MSHRPNIVKLLKINYNLKKQILKEAKGKRCCLKRATVKAFKQKPG